jgi:hypothetical protein
MGVRWDFEEFAILRFANFDLPDAVGALVFRDDSAAGG